jgi:hypothetical protein
MIYERERISLEAFRYNLRYFRGICLERLGKVTASILTVRASAAINAKHIPNARGRVRVVG